MNGYGTFGQARKGPGTLRRIWIACFALLLPAVAGARIVNVQSAASRKADEGLSAELAGAILWATGNTNVTQASAMLDVLYLDGPHRIFFSGRATRGIEDGKTFVNNLFEHLRYRYALTRLLSGEAFVQHEYDQFRRLKFRALFGIGPRIEFVFSEDWELALGSAWMLELERLSDDGAPDAGRKENNHRWSNYLAAGGEFTEGIAFTQTFYAQPRFDDFSDFRLLNETATVLDVKTWLAVKISFTAAYDSRPPAEVERLDTSLTTSLLFRL